MNVCARSDSEYDCVLILSETCRTYSMIVGVPMIMSPPKEALRFHIFQVPGRQSDPHIQRRHVLRPLGYWNWSTGTDHHKRRTSFHDQWYLQYFLEYWSWPTSLFNIHSWSAPEPSHKECKGNFDLLAEDHNCSVIIAVALDLHNCQFEPHHHHQRHHHLNHDYHGTRWPHLRGTQATWCLSPYHQTRCDR